MAELLKGELESLAALLVLAEDELGRLQCALIFSSILAAALDVFCCCFQNLHSTLRSLAALSLASRSASALSTNNCSRRASAAW